MFLNTLIISLLVVPTLFVGCIPENASVAQENNADTYRSKVSLDDIDIMIVKTSPNANYFGKVYLRFSDVWTPDAILELSVSGIDDGLSITRTVRKETKLKEEVELFDVDIRTIQVSTLKMKITVKDLQLVPLPKGGYLLEIDYKADWF